MTIQTELEFSHPHEEVQSLVFSVIGGTDPERLLQLVEEQLVVCERELKEIPLRAQGRGNEFVEAARAPMDRLLEQMGAYQKWLAEVEKGAAAVEEDDEDTWALAQAYRTGQELIPELTAALEAYTRFYSSYGPFESPFANSLAHLIGGIRSGQAPPRALAEYLVNFQRSCQDKAEQIQGLLLPGRSSCARAYRKAAGLLEKFETLEELEEEELSAALESLDAALAEGEATERLMKEGTEGPTAIPATNVLLSVVDKGLCDQLPTKTLERFFKDYCELMEDLWESFERSIPRSSGSALVQDEVPRTLEYADSHDAAVEELGSALEEEDEARARTAMEKIVAAVARLEESREVYKLAAQHQIHLICTECGRANPPENKLCEECGVILPRPAEHPGSASSSFSVLSGPALEESQQLQMTENVARLFQACDDVAVGKITPQQFQGEIDRARGGLREFAQELDNIADGVFSEEGMSEEAREVWREQHLPYVQEVAAAFVEAIQDVEAGLDEMALYLEEPSEEHLVEGVRIVWEGMGAIHRARLSMNANIKVLDDVLEEAAERGLLTTSALSDEVLSEEG